MKCPFCEINSRKTKIIQTKERTYVAFSNPRLVPGHLLVIPKRHVERLSELTTNELREVWDTIIEYQEKIIAGISPGCDIRQNYQPFQKQSRLKVDHLHIHLIPRKLRDEIHKATQLHEKNLFKNLTENEKKKCCLFLIKNSKIV